MAPVRSVPVTTISTSLAIYDPSTLHNLQNPKDFGIFIQELAGQAPELDTHLEDEFRLLQLRRLGYVLTSMGIPSSRDGDPSVDG